MSLKKILAILVFLSVQLQAQTYYKDVAGIFYNRCTTCHNQYSHGASLLTYSDAFSSKITIQSYLTSGEMPVWSPDTTFSRFMHEHIISPTEKTAILNWIAGGALPGDTTQAPTPPAYTRYQLNGTPDLELQIPTFSVNAYTSDSHDCFALPTGLLQDRIIRAFEIVPGNSSAVHHVIVGIDSTGTLTSDTSGNCYFTPSSYPIGGATPGSAPLVFPSQGPLKAGILLKAGSNIMLNIHYATGTAGQLDSTKVRIFFYPPGTTAGVRPVKMLMIKNSGFSLPADTISSITAIYPTMGALMSPISLMATYPHSHKLCTRLVNYAISQTDTIPLVKITNWNPNWQGWYTFRRLVKISAGHTLVSRHVFDNTSNNINNPFNPPQVINSGPTIQDEMLVDSYQYLDYQNGDENVNLDSLLSTDSLFSGPTFVQKAYTADKVSAYAYPNPFTQSTTLHYELVEHCQVSIDIYTSTGAHVQTLQNNYQGPGDFSVTWGNGLNNGALAPGAYYYVLRAGSKQLTGKLFMLAGRD